jgi:hypothetical protein
MIHKEPWATGAPTPTSVCGTVSRAPRRQSFASRRLSFPAKTYEAKLAPLLETW